MYVLTSHLVAFFPAPFFPVTQSPSCQCCDLCLLGCIPELSLKEK